MSQLKIVKLLLLVEYIPFLYDSAFHAFEVVATFPIHRNRWKRWNLLERVKTCQNCLGQLIPFLA